MIYLWLDQAIHSIAAMVAMTRAMAAGGCIPRPYTRLPPVGKRVGRRTDRDHSRHIETSLLAGSGVLWGPPPKGRMIMTQFKTLKLLGLPLALTASGLSIAAPAQARDNYREHRAAAWQLTPARSSEIRQDIQSWRTAIDRAAARRTISAREANGLRSDARAIQQLYGSYARNGLTRSEVQTLQNRVNRVRVALHQERRDWDRRRG